MASNSSVVSGVSAAVHPARRIYLGEHAGVQGRLNDGVDIVRERRHRRTALPRHRSSRSRVGVGRGDDSSFRGQALNNLPSSDPS